jgi:hypothetical protein
MVVVTLKKIENLEDWLTLQLFTMLLYSIIGEHAHEHVLLSHQEELQKL